MGIQESLLGTGVPAEDKTRRRYVTKKNRGTPYTPEQRRDALNGWWEANMQGLFYQLAQNVMGSDSALTASRAGQNVVDTGAEMEGLIAIKEVKKAFLATRGLAINSVELTDKIILEARDMQRASGIPHLTQPLSAAAINAFADVRDLSETNRQKLLQRINQRRLPRF